MFEDEFGYALTTLSDEIIPALELAGFTAVAGRVDSVLPALEASVSLERGAVTLTRRQRWQETAEGLVSVTRSVSLHLNDLANDHPFNVVLSDLGSKDARCAAIFDGAGKGYRDLELGGTHKEAILPSMSQDFAANLQSGLLSFMDSDTPARTRDYVTRTAEMLLLVERAAERGLAYIPSKILGVVYFGYPPELVPCIELRVTSDNATWQATSAYAVPPKTEAERPHGPRALFNVPLGFGESMVEVIDRGLALLQGGKNPQETTVSYLLGIADQLKTQGFTVTSKFIDPTAETDGPGLCQNLEICVGENQGGAFVVARNFFSVDERGRATLEALPSANFTNLAADHPDNLALNRFDALGAEGAFKVLRNLGICFGSPYTAATWYPHKTIERQYFDQGFIALQNLDKDMAPRYNFEKYAGATTSEWVTTVVQLQRALEAAQSRGFGLNFEMGSGRKSISFGHKTKGNKSNLDGLHLSQVFSLEKDPAGALSVSDTHTGLMFNGYPAGQWRAPATHTALPVSFDEAVQASCPVTLAHKDQLLDAALAYQVGDCWLESVDPVKGVALVGISPAWAGQVPRVLEVNIADWKATGFILEGKYLTSKLGLKGAVTVDTYAPLVEKHVLASINPALALLEKEAASLKMSNIRLAATGKYITLNTEDAVSGATKVLTLNIGKVDGKAGGQIVLTRDVEPPPQRPFLDVSGVRALELLLAPLASEMLEKMQERLALQAKSQGRGR